MTTEKEKSLKATLELLKKKFGQGTVMKMSDKPEEKIESISTSSISLDTALGVQGLPKGRVTEIYGSESSGKTTLALHAIAECQKKGGIAVFIDVEHALDLNYAKKIGVETDKLYLSQPFSAEQALNITEEMIRSSAIDIVVIDSVAALTPEAELKGDMGDNKLGVHARLMGQALRKLTGYIYKTNTCCIFINQLREKIGVRFGNPETTPGGNALKFYSSVRLDVRRKKSIQNKEGKSIANNVRVKVVKNKVASPHHFADIIIRFGEGICKYSDLVSLAIKEGVLTMKGAYYYYDDLKLGQGLAQTISALKDDDTLFASLYQHVVKKVYE